MNLVSRSCLVLALILAAINLRPGITSLAPLIERIANELALSRGLVSLTTVLPVLCMGLLAPVAPRLAQRFGLERTITVCLALIMLALLVRIAGHWSPLLIASAAVLGVGIAIAGPLLSGFIKQHFHGQFGQVVAWYSLGMAIGGAAGATLTAPLTHLFSGDWAWAMSLWAIPALLALAVWFRLPNTLEQSAVGPAQGLPWRQGRAWLLTGFFALQSGMFYCMTTWLVARYQEAGMSELYSNTLFALFMLIGLPSAWVLPWLAQRFSIRQPLLLGCALLTTAALSAICFWPNSWSELWALVLGVALTGTFCLALVLPLYEAGSPLAVSRWTAMMLGVGYCIAATLPLLVGVGRDMAGGYQEPFAVLIALSTLMVAFAWALRRPKAAS